jgi:hypothetical protein
MSRFAHAKISTAPDQSPPASLLVGRSGVGKTHFISTIPGIFILPTEAGMKGISPDHAPGYFADDRDEAILPTSVDEFVEAIRAFIASNKGGPTRYTRFAVDSLSGLESLVHIEACGSERVSHMEAKDYKKVWAAAIPVWKRVRDGLDAIRRTGVPVWVIAHGAEVADSSSSTGDIFKRWDLYLQGSGDVVNQTRQFWRQWADNVFFLEWATNVQKGTIATRARASFKGRILITSETPSHYAKTRLRLPAQMPATWQDLESAIKAGAPATEAKLRAQIAALLPRVPEAARAEVEATARVTRGANALAAVPKYVSDIRLP